MSVLDMFESPTPATEPTVMGDFWETLALWQATSTQIRDLEKEGDEKYQQAKAKARKGRKKKDELTTEELEVLRAPLLAEYSPTLDPLRAQAETLKARIDELAPTTPFREPREQWCLWKVKSTYDYITQGFGATTYAQNTADMYLLEAQSLGLEVRIDKEVTKTKDHSFYSIGDTATFKVMVKVHGEEDIQLLNRKPTMSLREWLKACWKRGVNPRVLNPYLSHGLEEKLGIDYFGNDLVSK